MPLNDGFGTFQNIVNQSGILPSFSSVPPSMLTNSNTGVLVSWGASFASYCGYTFNWDPHPPNGFSDTTSGCVPATWTYPLIATSGSSVTSNVTLNYPLTPILQRQDGSFLGQFGSRTVSFEQNGNIGLAVPNVSPQYATPDNGFVGTSPDGLLTETFDGNGNLTGVNPNVNSNSSVSWLGIAYSAAGSLADSISSAAPVYAITYAAIIGGNNSNSGTFVQQQWCPPLPSCYDPGVNASISCPGPKEAMEQALNSLKFLVENSCSTCATYVFQPLGSASDQAAFSRFLD